MNSDIQVIANKGSKIYQKIRSKYEPKENGKFLAINIKTKDVYLADTGADALALAQKHYPQTVFYLVKIGFNTAESVAKTYLRN